MNDVTMERLDALIAQLQDELAGASAGVRVGSEWRGAKASLAARCEARASLIGDADRLDTAIRDLEAQRDLLALAREESAEREVAVGKERTRREREDRAIVEAVRSFLPSYSLLAVGSVGLAVALGLPFGIWGVVGGLPAAFGWSEMRRRTRPMAGRSWVILNEDVEVVEDRVRIYDVIAGLGALLSLVFLAVAAAGS